MAASRAFPFSAILSKYPQSNPLVAFSCSERMNILFVLENYLPHIGGAEVVFMNLCESLVKRGHNVDIVTHQMKNSKKFEIINGVNIHRVNCFYSRYLFSFFSIPKVLQLANQSDLIHTTTFNGAGKSAQPRDSAVPHALDGVLHGGFQVCRCSGRLSCAAPQIGIHRPRGTELNVCTRVCGACAPLRRAE